MATDASASFSKPRLGKFRPNPKLKLRQQVAEVCRYRHMSHRTENAYWSWIRDFLRFWRGKDGGNARPHPGPFPIGPSSVAALRRVDGGGRSNRGSAEISAPSRSSFPEPGKGFPKSRQTFPAPGNSLRPFGKRLAEAGKGFPEARKVLPKPGKRFSDPGKSFRKPTKSFSKPGKGFPKPGKTFSGFRKS